MAHALACEGLDFAGSKPFTAKACATRRVCPFRQSLSLGIGQGGWGGNPARRSYAKSAANFPRRLCPPTMLSEPTRRKLGSILRSPALAVVAAYSLRMFLVWLTNQNEGVHPKLQVMGLEEGRVAWSLATGKGFFGPFPGYEALTAWLAPGYPFLWAICLKLARLNSEALILIGQAINCVFSAATCWPIYAIGKRLFGEKIGLASAWTWALLPYAILMSLEWTWDQCVAAFLFAVIVEATFRLRDSMSPLAWSGYGLSVGGCGASQPSTERPTSIPARLAGLSALAVRRDFARALRKSRACCFF